MYQHALVTCFDVRDATPAIMPGVALCLFLEGGDPR